MGETQDLGLDAEDARVQIAGADEPRYGVIDVRTMDEFSEGHLAGALLIEDGEPDAIEASIRERDKVGRWVLVCGDGARSRELAEALSERGVEAAYLEGGFEAWVKNDNRVQPPAE